MGARVKLTAGRIANFQCPEGKSQVFLWNDDPRSLAVRATPGSSRKVFIFQSLINGKTVRITIGETGIWSIDDAEKEAKRLQRQIDTGKDPRQVKAEEEAERLAKEAEAAALLAQQEIEAAAEKAQKERKTVTVEQAWEAYIAERSAAMKDGKPEWGSKHKAHHASFVDPGGRTITRGLRPSQGGTTRPGVLVPLMSMRLIDVDEKVIAAWLEKESRRAPTVTAQAFRALRAFLTWCGKQEQFRDAAHSDACKSDKVKNLVQTPKTKKNDSLRKAQLRPWFEAVKQIGNPVISAYLQCLLLTGARRNELATLLWHDVDFQWKSLTIRDKVEGERTIPLTPYVEHLISALPRRNEYVFSSPTAASGRLEEPRHPHNKALTTAGLPAVSLHGLRRSFGTLSEWVGVPVGIVAQIMGHKPSAIAEKHYIQRELDLLYLWHVKIENWILEQAGIQFVPVEAGLRIVKG